MALLWWLSEYWCAMPDRCRNGCRKPNTCTFGRLCEPQVDPAWPSKERHLMGQNAPPAYTLWDLGDRRRTLPVGAEWSFEMTLIGELALRQLPAVVAAVQEGAERGMGKTRLRGRLRRVDALAGVAPADEATRMLAVEKPLADDMVLTWDSYDLGAVMMGYRQAVEWAASLDGPARSLALRFHSPVDIKMRKQQVWQPDFTALARALVRRLRLLSLAHGGGEWPHQEWGPLLDLAETVRLAHHETFVTRYARHTKRSGDQKVEGFMGTAWYEADDLRPLLPALWLGQWLHIGKLYVLGNGRYSIEAVY
jgi:hypothetical protein